MNGVHDMGGMQNLGVIVPEPEGSPFHADWEGRVHAMTMASPTRANIDTGRHQREKIPGPEYLAMSYYEKWFRSLSELLVLKGFATREELATGKAAPGAKAIPHLLADAVEPTLTRRSSYVRDVAAAPLFAVGERVRARNINPDGHTRLPRYARGRVGVGGDRPRRPRVPGLQRPRRWRGPAPALYRALHRPRALGARRPIRADSVSLDLWEPYLERA